MKFIINKIAFTFLLLLFSSGMAIAQEIIKENAVDTIKKVNTSQKQKIDGVIAKVGDYIILD
ncbi:MAG: peptidylprolyl isomerase, partial [Flavobacterium sp.]|nr:peptidylprolyl isomerase [Flavobacterium sp.]